MFHRLFLVRMPRPSAKKGRAHFRQGLFYIKFGGPSVLTLLYLSITSDSPWLATGSRS
jgi:hypothetical protein